MKIAVLGAGAMGSLFGGYLSQQNEVWLVDINQDRVNSIVQNGVIILEGDERKVFHPHAVTDTENLEVMDLIIVFVKAMHSRDALQQNKHLIGEETYVMTLQNGAGHEEILLSFVDREQVIIGTTKHNSSITEKGFIHHGGGGRASIGLLTGESEKLQPIADNFTGCGFETVVSDDVEKQIWNKLFVNISASVLTAVLEVKLGYILDNEHAWFLAEKLIEEAVAVANAEGMDFEVNEVLSDLEELLDDVREGYTSIYADITSGVRTEVDTINGTVVRKGGKYGVPVPNHEFIVELVHAIEDTRET